MNVNNETPKKPTGAARKSSAPRKRIRRTAADAKALILETAARRLKAQGLDGLNLTGVAEDAGISHATIIHHFGGSEDMRRALVTHMTASLLTDVVTALQQEVPPVELCQSLVQTITENGHARLLAWLAVDSGTPMASPSEDVQTLFAAVIQTVADDLHSPHAEPGKMSPPCPEELERARNIVLLIASTAIGLGISGDSLTELLGMSTADRTAFPSWLATLVIGD
ncbi:MAG: TetR/AcrR family transcriptional regulator [Pseudomonadales bacterium]